MRRQTREAKRCRRRLRSTKFKWSWAESNLSESAWPVIPQLRGHGVKDSTARLPSAAIQVSRSIGMIAYRHRSPGVITYVFQRYPNGSTSGTITRAGKMPENESAMSGSACGPGTEEATLRAPR